MSSRVVTPNPELVWYYGGDCDADLGESSSYGAMIAKYAAGPGSTSTPTIKWPDERQCNAAARQVAVRQALRGLEGRQRATLDAAYEPRIYPQQVSTLFGDLVVGVVLRFQSAERTLRGSREYTAIEAFQRLLMRLHGVKKRAPEWTAITAEGAVASCDNGVIDAMREVAIRLILDAHAAYRDARLPGGHVELPAVQVSRVLVPMGSAGAAKRRLAPSPLPVAVHAA